MACSAANAVPRFTWWLK